MAEQQNAPMMRSNDWLAKTLVFIFFVLPLIAVGLGAIWYILIPAVLGANP